MSLQPKNRWVTIINRNSGGFKKQRIRQWISLCNRKNIDVLITESLSHLHEIASKAYDKGVRRFFLAGGDGSLHQGVNTIHHLDWSFEDVKIGFLPSGTGNDWAQNHRMSLSHSTLLEAMRKGEYFKVPLCKITFLESGKEELFCNIAGFGFDAFVAQEIDKGGKTGKSAYMKKVIQCLGKYKATTMKWSVDGVSSEKSIYSFHVGIGCTAGGGIKIIPHALKESSRLFATIIHKAPTGKYFQSLPKLITGNFKNIPFVEQLILDQIIIEGGPHKVGIECDGEWKGNTPCKIEISEHTVDVLDTRIVD